MSTTLAAGAPLAKQAVAQLKATCQQLGIKGYSKWTKAQLVDAVQAAMGRTQAADPAPTAGTVTATPVTTSSETAAGRAAPKTKAKRSRTAKSDASIQGESTAVKDDGAPKSKKSRKIKSQVAPSLAAASETSPIVPGITGVTSQANIANTTTSPTAPVPVAEAAAHVVQASSTSSARMPVPLSKSAINPPPAQKPIPQAVPAKSTPKTTNATITKALNSAPSVTSRARSNSGKPVIQGRKFVALKAAQGVSKPLPSLPAVTTPCPFPTATLSPAATADDRMSFMRSHFLERLFANLASARETPSPQRTWSNTTTSSTAASLAFQGFHPRIYTLSNAAFLAALRWWVARLYAALADGSGLDWAAGAAGRGMLCPDIATWPAVLDCRCVVGDIYLVVTDAAWESLPPNAEKSNRHPEDAATAQYLFLGHTGDVLGSSLDTMTGRDVVEGCGVRSDWAAHIRGQLLTVKGGGDVHALVKTKDADAAPGGISKSWRAREAAAPELVGVAERAVLASCSPNSGEKLSAAQMDAEWLSHTADLGAKTPRLGNAFVSAAATPPPAPGPNHPGPARKVELYLPEPLQILSVHASPHPALAVVHRASGKSDYVLRDTGHAVGDEDGGVVSLWQGILSCDARGGFKSQETFWGGWEARVRGDGGV